MGPKNSPRPVFPLEEWANLAKRLDSDVKEFDRTWSQPNLLDFSAFTEEIYPNLQGQFPIFRVHPFYGRQGGFIVTFEFV